MALIPWPQRVPKPLNSFRYKAALRGMFQSPGRLEKKALQLARNIVAEYLMAKDIRAALQTWMDFCALANDIKIKTTGFSAPTDKVNAFMQVVTICMVEARDFTTEEYDYILELVDALSKAGNPEVWFYPKVTIMARLIHHKTELQNFAQSFDEADISQDIMQTEQATGENFRLKLHNLAATLTALRKYGVKPCYFQDEAFCYPDFAWVVHEPFLDIQPMVVGQENYLAGVGLAQLASLTSLRMNTVAHIRDAHGQMKEVPHDQITPQDQPMETQVRGQAKVAFSVDLDFEGELFIGTTDRLMSVRSIFTRLGRPATYEVFRCFLLMAMFDLLVPVTLVSTLPKLASSMPRTPGNPHITALVAHINKLLLPRIRMTYSMPQIMSEIEKEMADAETDTTLRVPYVTRHEVVAHIRKLPPGRHHSERAKQLAWDNLHIILADDETYVVKHERGLGPNLVLGHEAVFR